MSARFGIFKSFQGGSYVRVHSGLGIMARPEHTGQVVPGHHGQCQDLTQVHRSQSSTLMSNNNATLIFLIHYMSEL